MAEMKTLKINDIIYDVVDANAVKFIPQELTEEQKAQARENIGVVGDGKKCVSGEVLVINDISSMSQDVGVKLTSDTVTDFSDVVVTTAGKNLFTYANFQPPSNVTLVALEGGSFKITNTASATRTIEITVPVPYGIPLVFSSTSDSNFSVKHNIDGKWYAVASSSFNKDIAYSYEGTLQSYPAIMLLTFIPANTEVIYSGVQIEIGTDKTDYEIPSLAQYNSDSYGNVTEVKSKSPIMTIFTNTKGVNIEAEYKIKAVDGETQQMIEDAKQEILDAITLKSKVSGCKMAVIGDSITTGMYSFLNDDGSVTVGGNLTNLNKAFWQQIRDRYGIAEVINNAKTGASFTQDGTTKDDAGNIVNRRFTTYLNETDLPPDLDAIIVWGGTNDFGYAQPFGTLESEPSTANLTNFYGAVRAVLEYLTAKFTEKEIIFITPLQRNTFYNNADFGFATFNNANNVGKYLRDYVDAIKTLCADYGVTCIDLYSNSKFYAHDREFLKTYMPDGLHPNVAGTDRYLNNGIFPTLDSLWLYRDIDKGQGSV
jgi:lysophospholipase L1-like esterase